jgi:uncharacterized protein (DUF4415 family)
VKKSVLDTYRSLGKGYQTRMNAVLESYAKTLRNNGWAPGTKANFY